MYIKLNNIYDQLNFKILARNIVFKLKEKEIKELEKILEELKQ